MNGSFTSPPRASRTVEMSSTRVKIINPLSLSNDVVESQDDSQNFPQKVARLTESESINNITPPQRQAVPSRGILLDPISLPSLVQNDFLSGTSGSAAERLEFPSSALDLYASLLQETVTIAQQNVDLSPPKSSLAVPVHLNDPASCGDSDVPLDSIDFGGHIPLPDGSLSQQMGLSEGYQGHSTGNVNLDGPEGIPKLESSIDASERVVEPPISFGPEETTSDEKDEMLNSRCVDRLQETIDSLPEVVENVSQAQRYQLVEVAKQKEILHHIKEILAEEKDKLEELTVELNTCKREICLAQEKGGQLQKQCKLLGNDVTNSMTEDFEIQKLTRHEEETLRKKQRLYEQYRSKMVHHSQAMTEVEASMGINMEVKKQQEIIAALQVTKTALESKLKQGTIHSSRLHQDFKSLAGEKVTLETHIADYEEKIKEECDKHAAINQDIEVLHKRNQAQMTRLKKQIKEGHLRIRQWNVEACQLERNLEELRKSMEE